MRSLSTPTRSGPFTIPGKSTAESRSVFFCWVGLWILFGSSLDLSLVARIRSQCAVNGVMDFLGCGHVQLLYVDSCCFMDLGEIDRKRGKFSA